MPSGPQSGKFGVVHAGSPLAAATPMFNWSLMDDMALETYYASNTRFGPQRNPGVMDWNGSFNMFSGFPVVSNLPILPGTKLSIEMFTVPDTGIYGNTGTIYYGDVIVDSVAITWQWQPTMSLTTAVNFSGTGLIADKKDVIDDLSLATPAKMCSLLPQYSIDDGSQWNAIDNALSIVWNLISANQPIVNSTTICGTQRQGGNIDWNMVVTEQEAEEIFTPGDKNLRLKLYIDPTTFWDIKWGIVRNYSNITVNRQTGEVLSKDLNIDMNALENQELGEILMPNTNIYWPPQPTTVTVGFGGINEPPWKTVPDV